MITFDEDFEGGMWRAEYKYEDGTKDIQWFKHKYVAEQWLRNKAKDREDEKLGRFHK